MKKFFIIFIILISVFGPLSFVFAQDANQVTQPQDQVSVYKVRVTAILSDQIEEVPGTGVKSDYQTMQVEFLNGPKKGSSVTFSDDYIKVAKGDVIYIQDTVSAQTGQENYSVQDFDRLPTLLLFGGLFIILVILIGGWQGLRGLLSLAGSLLLIMYVLLPGILHGFSPILVSIVVASFIIVLGSYITHGFNKTTSSAVVGMIFTVITTGCLAFIAVHMGKFSGYGSDEAIYLNMNTGGHIDIIGIFLSGIIIGLLGVLYDVSIGQAISVEELHHIAPHISRRTIYARALRMGREHIGALVNTLAIAYVGVALPLLLLFSQSNGGALITLNREVFSEEIIRTLVGSIGLVLAVPITTLLAVWMLIKVKKSADPSILNKEKEALAHFEHHH